MHFEDGTFLDYIDRGNSYKQIKKPQEKKTEKKEKKTTPVKPSENKNTNKSKK